MKKICVKIIATLLILSCLSLPAFAADSITVGEVTEADKAVTVNFAVTNLQADDEVTILVYKKEIDEEKSTETTKVYKEPDETNIKYINQITPENNSISFNLLTTAAEGLYEVRMGGTGIETTSIGQFTISSIIYGDLDSENGVDIMDAIWILRFLSDVELPGYVNIENGDIDSEAGVDVMDAIWILRYLSGAELPDYVKLPRE